jgi:hypothetical protein
LKECAKLPVCGSCSPVKSSVLWAIGVACLVHAITVIVSIYVEFLYTDVDLASSGCDDGK